MSAIRRVGTSPARLALITIGVLALLVALTTPSALAPLEGLTGAVVDTFGHDYSVAAGLGVLAVIAAVAVLLSGRGSVMHQTEMPAVERPVPVPAAGEPLDEAIGRWRMAIPLVGRATLERVRDRLRSAAVVAVASDEGCSRPDARKRVEDGTWTDDPVAAAFLADRSSWVGAWLSGLANRETGPEYRTRRTVEAIVARRRNGIGPGGRVGATTNGHDGATTNGPDVASTNGQDGATTSGRGGDR